MGPCLLVVTGPVGVGKSTVCTLLAERFERTVNLSGDTFASFISHGFVEQWRPEAARQNETLGAALAVAAMSFVDGGYTVLLDANVFPDGFDRLAQACRARGLPAHYAVLRTDLTSCIKRAVARGSVVERRLVAALHDRFEDLGIYEPNVIDAAPPPNIIASHVLGALVAGELAPRSSG